MGFQGGFSNSRKSSILMKEEGSGEVKRVSTLIVSSGTLGNGSGQVTLDTGGETAIEDFLSGTDGQIAVFSGSSNIVGYDQLTYDQTTVNVTGNIKAQDIEASNVYSGDIHMKNERGDWTIFEEKTSLIVQNNLTGQRFKLVMEEIED
jgi:hypothetical protein